MWLKNLQIYRLPAPWDYTPEQLGAAIASQAFSPLGSFDVVSQGWVSPRANEQLIHVVNKQMLLKLVTEKRLLPGSVVSQAAKVKAEEHRRENGFWPGKKLMKEIKEAAADELLPRAFPVRSTNMVWIDPVNGWLVVDSSSPGRADDVLKLLLKAIDKLPVENLRVQQSPVAAMTSWLENDEAPAGFTVDQDTELRATGESKAAVRFVNHTLEADDIARHLAAGKQCTRLALTWNDKISFVLTEGLCVKGVKALSVLKESAASAYNDTDRFDSDMFLMTAELNQMLNDVVQSLGGFAKA